MHKDMRMLLEVRIALETKDKCKLGKGDSNSKKQFSPSLLHFNFVQGMPV